MPSPKPDPEGDALGEKLRGLPQDGRSLGTAAHVPHLRARRLLRFLEGQARDEAFRGDRPPDHAVGGARPELALVLRRSDLYRIAPAVGPGTARRYSIHTDSKEGPCSTSCITKTGRTGRPSALRRARRISPIWNATKTPSCSPAGRSPRTARRAPAACSSSTCRAAKRRRSSPPRSRFAKPVCSRR